MLRKIGEKWTFLSFTSLIFCVCFSFYFFVMRRSVHVEYFSDREAYKCKVINKSDWNKITFRINSCLSIKTINWNDILKKNKLNDISIFNDTNSNKDSLTLGKHRLIKFQSIQVFSKYFCENNIFSFFVSYKNSRCYWKFTVELTNVLKCKNLAW